MAVEENGINIRQFGPKKFGPGYLLRFLFYAIILGVLLWLINNRLEERNKNNSNVFEKTNEPELTPIQIE